jgi:2-methylcitrate dehydratase PrpD
LNGLDYLAGTSRANTVKVADFIVKVAAADIPSAAADVAARCILDFTGVALAGGSE